MEEEEIVILKEVDQDHDKNINIIKYMLTTNEKMTRCIESLFYIYTGTHTVSTCSAVL